ncbi:MAG TPA: hypothetical protein PKO19_13560, partial [Chitinophagales bacterium]|nr:hypothetical protein [Chitinophagales bacterium]HNK99134.1 hypothetical protein [Chitinophagales bacterium]
MKTNKRTSIKPIAIYILLLIFIGSNLFSAIGKNTESYRKNELTFQKSGSTLIVFPDSVPVELDTSTAFEIGDTIDINLAGLDTLFILYEDTNSIGGDTVSEGNEFRLVDATKDITITPGFLPKEVEHGLFGYHIEGIFTSERLPQDTANVNFPQSWRWMADLKPQVLRFPGGASSRWMHLLPYQDAEAPFDTLDPIKGYGYDITEIIRYYDGTDGDIDAEDSVYVNSIIYDLADASCDSCDNWMYAFKYADDFEKLYDKWINQENNIPTNQQQRYIDQFIALVDSIQQWESYTVDVIVDLNVISESATDCRHIIDYLRNPAPKAEGG